MKRKCLLSRLGNRRHARKRDLGWGDHTNMSSSISDTTGVLRAFVEAIDIEEGTKIANELTKLIDESLGARLESVEAYWKIPKWFEVLIRIPGASTNESAWTRIQPLCINWQLSRNATEINAIWSLKIGGNTVHPKVMWISVNLYPV
jgi:hypothetical protein